MAASSANNEKIEPILYLLSALIVLFTSVLIGVEWAFKDDAQVFQVVASILSGLAGAFMARIKPANQNSAPLPAQPSAPDGNQNPVPTT